MDPQYNTSSNGGSQKINEAINSIDRILKKIDSLRDTLKPIISSLPELESEKRIASTELQAGLNLIDDRITNLLDTVRL